VITKTIQDALNEQIRAELNSSYAYLGMSTHCELHNFHGAAKWLRLQSEEEYRHGMRIVDFMLARDCQVELRALDGAVVEFESLLAIFETALKQEEEVSRRIDDIYVKAFDEKSFATLIEMQWFLTEQVREERAARNIVHKLQLVRDDPAALLEIDRELGQRGTA